MTRRWAARARAREAVQRVADSDCFGVGASSVVRASAFFFRWQNPSDAIAVINARSLSVAVRSPTSWSRPSSPTAWTRVFGMVGHSNLGFADALRRAEDRGELTFYRHPTRGRCGVRCVSAYGKLTGRPAACFAIAGPGSTNLLTGLYDAKLDQSPVIAISGQVPSKVLGRGAFQDLDLSAVFKDVAITSDGRARGQ